MKDKDLVYLLTIKEALELAQAHEDDPDWDLWTDPKALGLGLASHVSSNLRCPESQTAI